MEFPVLGYRFRCFSHEVEQRTSLDKYTDKLIDGGEGPACIQEFTHKEQGNTIENEHQLRVNSKLRYSIHPESTP